MNATLTSRPANENAAPPIMVWEIRAKDWTRFGHKHAGELAKGHHAEIVPGERIRLFGDVPAGSRYARNAEGRQVPCEGGVYKRDFRIGDTAAVGGFNLTYMGTIRAITEKTVTVVEYEGTSNEKVHRMDLYKFDSWNWNFDVNEAAARNLSWRD